MQSQRDLLEYLFNNVSTDREFLAESVNMLYRTFRYNIRILENGGSLKRQKGSGRPAKIVGDCKKRLSQIALKNPFFQRKITEIVTFNAQVLLSARQRFTEH